MGKFLPKAIEYLMISAILVGAVYAGWMMVTDPHAIAHFLSQQD
jgi:hypothetical protein